MNACAPTEHDSHLVLMDHDGASYYIVECQRCLTQLPLPSGYCYSCGDLLDRHRFFLADEPVCPRPGEK